MSKISNRAIKMRNAESKVGKNIQFHDGLSSVKNLGAGDTFYVHDLLSEGESKSVFAKLLWEIKFKQMFNVSSDRTQVFPIPRLVSAQTCKRGETSPIYRMPGCNQSNIVSTEWTPTVQSICERAEKVVSSRLNHCVATLFRCEKDSLGFHKDKLIDLEGNSLILSISFGASRPMLIEEVDGKRKHSIILRPGSLIAIGPETNQLFEHAIPKLKDQVGPRISLSVRNCSSFIDRKTDEIVGQGEAHQTKNYPFVSSHDDLAKYPKDVLRRMEEFCESANHDLTTIRSRFPTID